MTEPKFKPGDRVDFTNSYGVTFPGKTIVGLDAKATAFYGVPYYDITPTDSPWVSVPEIMLTRTVLQEGQGEW